MKQHLINLGLLLIFGLAACSAEDTSTPQGSPSQPGTPDAGDAADQTDEPTPDTSTDLNETDAGQDTSPDVTQDLPGEDTNDEDINDADIQEDVSEPPDMPEADMPPEDMSEPDVPEPDMPELDMPDDSCPDNATVFQEEIWEPFMSRRCAGCHVEGGLAAQTRFVLQQEQESPTWVEHNLTTLTAMALELDGDLPTLLARPSGRHSLGHTGGTLLTPDTGDYNALARLTARLRDEADTCDNPLIDPPDPEDLCEDLAPGPRLLRRLTHQEYRNTVRDLTGVDLDAATQLSADTVVHGFDNNARALEVSPLLADQYRTLAEQAAQNMAIAPIAPCGEEQDPQTCAHEFIARFGQRSFRRPLTIEEQAPYRALFAQVQSEDGYAEGIRWVTTALLQSPHFLYRAELGRTGQDGRFALTSWEIATELSYLFWGTTPDDTLLALAASGELATPEVITNQTQRLLADPKSQAVAQNFTWRWLGLDQLHVVTRDPDLYPDLTPTIREAMGQETERLLGQVWQDGGSLSDLLLADHTWLNPELAQFYGLDAGDGQGWRQVSLADSPYGGLLTQGSLLMTHALPTGSSPIHRGLLIREHFLCQELPPPPANLDTSPPPVDQSLSTRQRYAQHADDLACAGCHDLIDPIGFGFEHFDADGRWRDMDGPHNIDDTGHIEGTRATDTDFEGLLDLSSQLASSPDVQACYTGQWLRYGYGLDQRLDLDGHTPNLRDILGDGTTGLSEVVVALTQDTHFTTRIGEPGEQDLPYGEPAPLQPTTSPEDHVDPDADPNDGQLQVDFTEQSRWQSGYCAQVQVSNVSSNEITWTIELDIEGTIYNAWESMRSADTGLVSFSGANHNATLGPGQRASFGFCANL